MDKRSSEPFVQLKNGIAQTRKNIRSKLHGGIASIHDVLKGFALHVLHDYHEVFPKRVAIGYARNIEETTALTLRFEHALVRRAQSRIAGNVFPNERALLGPIRSDEHDALRGFKFGFLQYRLDAIAFLALK